jgi:hypothetical protein
VIGSSSGRPSMSPTYSPSTPTCWEHTLPITAPRRSGPATAATHTGNPMSRLTTSSCHMLQLSTTTRETIR